MPPQDYQVSSWIVACDVIGVRPTHKPATINDLQLKRSIAFHMQNLRAMV
jgi:hypothetical protein